MKELTISKVVCSYRIWIENSWRGAFDTKEEAEEVVKRIIYLNKKGGRPINLYTYNHIMFSTNTFQLLGEKQ